MYFRLVFCIIVCLYLNYSKIHACNNFPATITFELTAAATYFPPDNIFHPYITPLNSLLISNWKNFKPKPKKRNKN